MTQPNDDRTSNDDIQRVSAELAGRLSQLGIRVTGSERPEDLLDIVEAVDRWETAVESRGGDLMMDEGVRGPAKEPDDRHFALPVRRDDESVSDYLERLERATADVRRHAPRAD